MARFRIDKIRRSIFLKIIFIFCLAAIATIYVMHIFQRDFLTNDELRTRRSRTLSEYGRLTAQAIGFPPKESVLKDFARRLNLKYRVTGPGVSLASSNDIPAFADVQNQMMKRLEENGVSVGRYGDYSAIEVTVKAVRGQNINYLFLLNESPIELHSQLILLPIVALLIILLLCYFGVRAVLSPLREIERGVNEVTLGNLQVELKVPQIDELGRLARSFNRMTREVRTMVRSKEQLLLDVSHEFRSPLTRVKVALEIPGTEARSSIVRAVKDLEIMITELLESARLDDSRGQLKLARTDLALTLRELSTIYESQKPGVRILFPASLQCVCLVDPARVQIALRNITENALKYSANASRPVEINLVTNEMNVIITIRDFGEGIPPEDIDRIFEPFYRVDPARTKSTGGYGLGLALTKKIIHAHLGKISVESVVDEGSTFTIEFLKSR